MLNILAIDTTGSAVTAAISADTGLLGEVFINGGQNHSVTLMPMIKRLLESVNMKVSDLTHIACASGPGSFTGLRIGAATAKALAYALNIPIVPVPTLDALAYNVFDINTIIVPIMDAKRRQVYTAFYERNAENGMLNRLSDYRASDISEVLQELAAFNRRVIFLGDAVSVYCDTIFNNPFNLLYLTAPFPAVLQRASSVAGLAALLIHEGKTADSGSFIPFYLRKPQAERERELRVSELRVSELRVSNG